METYPHIGLREDRFDVVSIGILINNIINTYLFSDHFWRDAANCRRLLIEFAEENKFDPLVTKNWYPVTSDDIQRYKVCNTTEG